MTGPAITGRRAALARLAGLALLPTRGDFAHYVEEFNAMVPEDPVTTIPDAKAWEWMSANIPWFSCPDPDFERTYYYRWWTYRKHIKQTPAGFIVTEFLKPVNHATEYNAISCALGHQVAEGRWLCDQRYLDEDLKFWLTSGPDGGLQKHFHQFSGWVAASCYERWKVTGNTEFLLSLLPALRRDYAAWEQERLTPDGLFWQRDVSDGMEDSISGGRRVKNRRPTINSYMYGNAQALAAIENLTGNAAGAREFTQKAERLRELVESRLWNREHRFFETLTEAGEPSSVRELAGYTPWLFELPTPRQGYEEAWLQILDPQGFAAPYGPTTAEQRHPGFRVAETGDDCQWNGPSWPFATTVALQAMANVVNSRAGSGIGAREYFQVLRIYTHNHRLKLPDGRVIPWVDEDQNPFTGVWQAREMKIRKGRFNGRGNHYNHSAYADLVLTGLCGLRPRADAKVEVNPLAPAEWDWWMCDRVPYRGRMLSIVWDRTGKRFGKGKGLQVFADGRRIAHDSRLRRVLG